MCLAIKTVLLNSSCAKTVSKGHGNFFGNWCFYFLKESVSCILQEEAVLWATVFPAIQAVTLLVRVILMGPIARTKAIPVVV